MTTAPVPPINPSDNPEQYDYCWLAGMPTPGLVEVTGGDRKHKWDKKEAKGSSGATITSQGAEPAEPTMKVRLWFDRENNINHFWLWDLNIKPILEAALEGKTAIDIYHPSLAANGINSVVVQEVSQLAKEGEDGLHSITIKFLEFRPPKPAGATPKGSKSGQKPKKPYENQGPDPLYPPDQQDEVDAVEKAREDLQRQLDDLNSVFGEAA
jgi:hypothetical protein